MTSIEYIPGCIFLRIRYLTQQFLLFHCLKKRTIVHKHPFKEWTTQNFRTPLLHVIERSIHSWCHLSTKMHRLKLEQSDTVESGNGGASLSIAKRHHFSPLHRASFYDSRRHAMSLRFSEACIIYRSLSQRNRILLIKSPDSSWER